MAATATPATVEHVDLADMPPFDGFRLLLVDTNPHEPLASTLVRDVMPPLELSFDVDRDGYARMVTWDDGTPLGEWPNRGPVEVHAGARVIIRVDAEHFHGRR